MTIMTTTTRTFGVTLLAAIGIGAGIRMHARAQNGSPTPPACETTRLQRLAPSDTTITGAAHVAPAGRVPGYCRVDGTVAVPGNNVAFRLGLPDSWNGKFYFQGVGGLGGTIGSLDTGLSRGYASASTDTGHDAKDPHWGANRAKEIDYGHRGTHVTAVAAKALAATHYGRAPEHAYFNGCSNGGRQALMEVQRYPDDFDGIIAGHPASGTPMQLGRALVFQHMLASPANYLPAEKVEVLARATLDACDATDGLRDGLVSDPRRCTFRPERLKCAGPERPDCLTEGQIETVSRVYRGVVTAAGKRITPGLPVGHEGGSTGWTSWIVGAVPPEPQADGTLAFGPNPPAGFRLQEQNFSFLALDEDDPSFNWRQVRLERDLPRLRVMTEILSPSDPDLRPFAKRRGKLIMYHGWADPAISAYGTIDYYDRMVKAVGGQRTADEFTRLYLAPGMHHCAGGPGFNTFDMLPVLEGWVERGVAPGPVIASRPPEETPVRTRPLCPHPLVARYTGQGSIDDAANFVCRR